MASKHTQESESERVRATDAPPLLRDFRPVAALWEGDAPPYPSQQSALWAIRQLRGALAEAGAIALHRGRTFIHLDRMAVVVERDALDKARKRYCRS
ncbi:hypothetical protein WG922_17455 [Ramlibacter sp. AN1015]|uniref:hypothetical protein n=1 Tax=Ramlibacter sp. AN1015 TaxID=3133428 RepID=UPI0030BE0D48